MTGMGLGDHHRTRRLCDRGTSGLSGRRRGRRRPCLRARLLSVTTTQNLQNMKAQAALKNPGDLARRQRLDCLDEQIRPVKRSEEHTSELQSLVRISYAVFCLKNKKTTQNT